METKKYNPPDHDLQRNAYDALRDPDYDNFVLVPCTCNGEPTLAISAKIDKGPLPNGKRLLALKPLFVGVVPGMVLLDTHGQEAVTREEWDKREREGTVPKLNTLEEMVGKEESALDSYLRHILELVKNGREQHDHQ